jgi:hypothetical protein
MHSQYVDAVIIRNCIVHVACLFSHERCGSLRSPHPTGLFTGSILVPQVFGSIPKQMVHVVIDDAIPDLLHNHRDNIFFHVNFGRSSRDKIKLKTVRNPQVLLLSNQNSEFERPVFLHVLSS